MEHLCALNWCSLQTTAQEIHVLTTSTASQVQKLTELANLSQSGHPNGCECIEYVRSQIRVLYRTLADCMQPPDPSPLCEHNIVDVRL